MANFLISRLLYAALVLLGVSVAVFFLIRVGGDPSALFLPPEASIEEIERFRRLMGFEPMEIPYLRMATEMGLGEARIKHIELVGDAIDDVNFGFQTKKSLVIWGDQLIRLGPLRFAERLLLHSPLVVWAPFASNVYHDWMWYPTVGKSRIREFSRTEWGSLFREYAKR